MTLNEDESIKKNKWTKERTILIIKRFHAFYFPIEKCPSDVKIQVESLHIGSLSS